VSESPILNQEYTNQEKFNNDDDNSNNNINNRGSKNWNYVNSEGDGDGNESPSHAWENENKNRSKSRNWNYNNTSSNTKNYAQTSRALKNTNRNKHLRYDDGDEQPIRSNPPRAQCEEEQEKSASKSPIDPAVDIDKAENLKNDNNEKQSNHMSDDKINVAKNEINNVDFVETVRRYKSRHSH
jgi:hypothetical protein